MNGINIPKNVADKLQYMIVRDRTSPNFEKSLKDAINSIKENNYVILNIDIKDPVIFNDAIQHYAHILYYKP